MRILLGPAGIPHSTKGTTQDGIREVKRLDLGCMEIEFVHGVYMKRKIAEKMGVIQKETGIKLSVHAPYYVNLASAEPEKIKASKQRILDSCECAHYMNANPVVFHPGYYGSYTPQETFELMKTGILDITDKIKEKGWRVKVALETTGKVSQFGTLDELSLLLKEIGTKYCTICLDFAHMWARYNGVIDYKEVMDKIKKLKLPMLHSHFSQIEFTEKGERRHLTFADAKQKSPPVKQVCRAILGAKQDVTIISESPLMEEDALKMKKVFEELGHKF